MGSTLPFVDTSRGMRELFVGNVPFFLFTFLVVTGTSSCQTIIPWAFVSPAASSFSFCRPAVEYRALPEDFKHQLSRHTGGNLTWHDGRGQKTAGGRTVKLLQQPGTEALQVRLTTSIQSRVLCTASDWFVSVPQLVGLARLFESVLILTS